MLSIWTWVKSLFTKKQEIKKLVSHCNRHLRFIKNCIECKKAVANG